MWNIRKSRNKPVLTDLYGPNQEDLNYPELLFKCSEIEINISDKEIEMVEQDARTQAKGPGFFRYRYKNCGFFLNVTPRYPILTFVKRLQAELSIVVCDKQPGGFTYCLAGGKRADFVRDTMKFS